MGLIESRLTYEHLRQLPDDGRRYELVDGELVGSPVPKWRHQVVVANLFDLLRRAKRAGFGAAVTAPTDVVLDPELNAVQPDLVFIAAERVERVVTQYHVAGAPDLVVEVLSDGAAERDLGVKPRIYARYGVRFCWIADPETQTVRVFEAEAGGYRDRPPLRGQELLACPLFPGIAATVAEIFAD